MVYSSRVLTTFWKSMSASRAEARQQDQLDSHVATSGEVEDQKSVVNEKPASQSGDGNLRKKGQQSKRKKQLPMVGRPKNQSCNLKE